MITPELQLELEALPDGHSTSKLLCPHCGGGRTKELSLSMWRKGSTAGLKCWRASCGYTKMVTDIQPTEAPPLAFKARPFRGDLLPLSDGLHATLLTYHISLKAAKRWGFKTAFEGVPQLYMPVYSPYGVERGGVLKRWDREPKNLSFKHLDQPWQAWYRYRKPRSHLIVVEDQLSALRAYQLGMDAVALLGTNLNREKAAEIQQNRRGSSIHIALDKDAFAKACRYSQKYSGTLQSPLHVVLLDKDLKDTTDDDIQERIFGRRSDHSSNFAGQASV